MLISIFNPHFFSVLHPHLIKCCIFIKNNYKFPLKLHTQGNHQRPQNQAHQSQFC